MKQLILAVLAACAFAAPGAVARTATEEFVVNKVAVATNATLAAAKAYTDEHSGAVSSVNGKTGVVVISEVNSATNWINKPWWIEEDRAAIANEANYSTDAGHVPWHGIEEKPDWIGNSKPTYTADEVGALPVDGKAQSAEFADEAGNAETAINAQFADEATTAPWGGITDKPAWIGDSKPTYTASEVGAAPVKTMLVLGGTSPDYELRLNGVEQTFEQVKGFLNAGEVVVRHLNGLYKPTYSSEAEIMFDCVGMISGKIETRRIHMIASGAVSLDPLKVLAEEAWVLGLSTTYTNLAGSAFVSLNQSVQTVTVDGAPVTISMPTAVAGGTRDFVVYVNNTSAATDAPLVLPAGTYYADDDAATNAFTKGTVSALYITEMDGAFMIGRKELKQIVVQ